MTAGPTFGRVWNGTALALDEVPCCATADELVDGCIDACRTGARMVAFTAVPARDGARELVAVLARDGAGELAMARAKVTREFPTITDELPQAHAFERELLEEHDLVPVGHPWSKPLRRHRDLETGHPADGYPFFSVDGPGVHEVAVGPVHAGIIEPGHFRFQCVGETVTHLEIQLGYQHRGVVQLLESSSPARRLAIAETIAGDTTIGHASAHVRLLEALAGIEAPLRAQALRGVALELERLANHTGDLGALAGDVGYLPAASYFGRLRGEFLNLTAELCGSRFGRGLIVPGGVRFDLDGEGIERILARLLVAERELLATADMLFGTASVQSRFEGTGVLAPEVAADLGVVGPAGRASGQDRDVRQDHPDGIYRFAHIPVARLERGDVMARAMVRRIEIERSIVFVREQLGELAPGPVRVEVGPPAPEHVAVALCEGWRGELVHLAITDAAGALAGFRIVDPSLHNWFGLAMAMRGTPISDFPLCNKSFNLSYAGHDL